MTTLYRKYRPQAWAEVAGQNHVKVTLGFEIASNKIAHAYLFSGPRGVGKTTTARIFSRAVNCAKQAESAGEPCGACDSCVAILENRSLDVIEIDAASHRGIDAVRENIIENSRFSPSQLKYKVFIIDEVHMLTTEAFNALLKTLEEPPAHAVFILATTELHKVPATILSRCQRFDFRKIPFTDMVERLQGMAESEKVKVDKRTLEEISRQADGSLRDAESLLGKVLTMGDGKRVTYDEALVVLPRSDAKAVADFVHALLQRDARTAIMTIGDCLESGIDLDQFATDAIELLRRTLLAKMSGNPEVFSSEMDEESKKRLAEWSGAASMTELVTATETLMEKRREIRASHPPQLPLELAVIRICEGMKKEEAAPSAPAKSGGVVAAVAPAPVVAKKEPTKKAVAAVAEMTEAPVAEERSAGGDSQGLPASADPAEGGGALVGKAGRQDPPPISVPASEVSNGEPVSTVDRIRAVWTDFMAKAGDLNAGLPYVLGVGTPTEVSGNVVRIGFDFAFHRDKMNNEKNRRLLETALGGILGKDVRVEGVLLEKKDGADADPYAGQFGGPQSREAALSPAPSLQPAAAGGAAFDGNILTAFGGRVVE